MTGSGGGRRLRLFTMWVLVATALQVLPASAAGTLRDVALGHDRNVETLPARTADATNHAPSDIVLSPVGVRENRPVGTVVGHVTAVDQDPGDVLTYTLAAGWGGQDNALFTLDPHTGELATAAVLDREEAAFRHIRVRVTDGRGGSAAAMLLVWVVDVNEAPTDVHLSPSRVDENQPAGTVVGTVSGTDPDRGDVLRYALVDGWGSRDNHRFALDPTTGVLTTTQPLDREEAAFRYIRVRVTDRGGLRLARDLLVGVANVNEAPAKPTLTPWWIPENRPGGSVVGTVSAVDPDVGDVVRYTLVSGFGASDNALFALDPDTGELSARQSFDFETKAYHQVRVRATDRFGYSSANYFQVRVRDENDAPTGVDLTPGGLAENLPPGTVVGTLSAVDPDAADTASFALVAGAGDSDNALFSVDGQSGTLTALTTFDFEATPSASIRVRVTDAAGESAEQAVTIAVHDVNEAPTSLALDPIEVAENEPVATLVGRLTGQDPDAGDSLSYALATGAGDDDNGLFAIDGDDLVTATSFDYEATPTLSVRIRVTDSGGLSREESFVVEVIDVDEAPVVGDDLYDGLIGNTQARAGTIVATGPTLELTADLPLANDHDPEGQPLNVVPVTGAATALGGRITVRSDGSFRYLPPVGVRAVDDTVTYTVSDGTLTATGTLTFRIGTRTVWYVDAAAAGGGDGRSATPLQSLSPLSGTAGADQDGDQIFVHSGNYPAGLALRPGQTLTGEGAGLSPALVPVGTAPEVSVSTGAAVDLATGTRVEGMRLRATSTAVAVRAVSVADAIVASDVTVEGGAGDAVVVSGGSGTLDLGSQITPGSGRALSITGRTGGSVLVGGAVTTRPAATSGGILLTDNSGTLIVLSGEVNLATGTAPAVRVTGGGTLEVTGSTNTLTTTSGVALAVVDTAIGSQGLDFASISATTGAPSGIELTNTGAVGELVVRGGSIDSATGSAVTLTKSRATIRGLTIQQPGLHGVELVDPAGAVSFVDSTVSGAWDTGVRLSATSGTSSLQVQGSTISDSGRGGGARDGVQVQVGGTATVGEVSIRQSTFSGNLGDHIQIASSGGTLTRATVSGNTLTGGSSGALGQGIVINATGSPWTGRLGYDVDDNSITGARASAIVVSASGVGTGASMAGHVRRNRVGTPGVATSCSATGSGISVASEQGTSPLVASITGNTLHGCASRGVSLTAGDGAGTLQATVTGNTVQGLGGSATYGLAANVGITSADSGTSCLDLSGNTFTGAAGYEGISVRHRWAGLRLPGYAGGATDAAAVTTYLTARNASTAVVSTPLTGTYSGGGGCQAPGF